MTGSCWWRCDGGGHTFALVEQPRGDPTANRGRAKAVRGASAVVAPDSSQQTLSISDDLSIPLDAVTSTFAILGVRGAGKTNTAVVLSEEILSHGVPVVILDPTGAHYGLRSSADGTAAGFPVVIFGGRHADVPLAAGSGEAIARLVVEQRIPAVMDLSLMRRDREKRAWAADFLETLYQENTLPLHVLFDEAQILAPQQATADMMPCRDAAENVLLLGRGRGLGGTIASQRIAKVSKTILSQVETLILLRTVGGIDIAAIDDWIANHATAEQAKTVKASLGSLPAGSGWVWSPAFLNVLQRVQIRRRRTFDSSATPKVGQTRIEPERWANIDLTALGASMAAAVDVARQTDPTLLREQVASLQADNARLHRQITVAEQRAQQLQAELAVSAARPAGRAELDPEFVAALTKLEAGLQHAARLAESLPAAAGAAVRLVDDDGRAAAPASPARAGATASSTSTSPTTTRRAHAATAAAAAAPERGRRAGTRTPSSPPRVDLGPGQVLPKAQKAALTALAPYAPGTRSLRQIALLTGYSINGGGFRNAIGALRTAGFVSGTGAAVAATEQGLVALGSYTPLPTGAALLEHWYGQLGKAPRLVLQDLAAAWPSTRTLEQVADATDYVVSGGGFRNAVGRLRTLELISGSNEALRAADELFGEGAPR